MADKELEIVRTVIDAHNSDQARAYAAGDIDAVAAVFAEDAWQMLPNVPPLVGREAVRGFWSEAVRWGRWQFSLESQRVDVSGSLAVERGKYRLQFTAGPAAPPGMKTSDDWGNYLVHWRREADSEWRIVGDAPVSERPLSPAAPQ